MDKGELLKDKGSSNSERKTDEAISKQVYVIAASILNLAKSVEEALANITAVKQVLYRISQKLNFNQSICAEERDLLELAEQWLREENVLQCKSSNEDVRNISLSQIAALGDCFHCSGRSCSPSVLTTPSAKQFSVGSTQTLNEDHQELDWDGHGLELVESIHSTYSENVSAFENPYSLAVSTETKEVVKSASYNGIYEEEMECTLEIEEGFYSDASFAENLADVLQPNKQDFSPQADSGVTHLDYTNSSDRSMSHADEDFPLTPPLKYNKEINTWDTFAMVNLEEDMLSTPSSANNSASSTPRFSRKRRSVESCITSPKRSDNSPQPLLALTEESHKKLPNNLISSAKQTLTSRSRANSVEESTLYNPIRISKKKTFVSTPTLSMDEPDVITANSYISDSTQLAPVSNKKETTLSQNSLSATSTHSAGSQSMPSTVQLSENLKKKNYCRKFRLAVFV